MSCIAMRWLQLCRMHRRRAFSTICSTAQMSNRGTVRKETGATTKRFGQPLIPSCIRTLHVTSNGRSTMNPQHSRTIHPTPTHPTHPQPHPPSVTPPYRQTSPQPRPPPSGATAPCAPGAKQDLQASSQSASATRGAQTPQNAALTRLTATPTCSS